MAVNAMKAAALQDGPSLRPLSLDHALRMVDAAARLETNGARAGVRHATQEGIQP